MLKDEKQRSHKNIIKDVCSVVESHGCWQEPQTEKQKWFLNNYNFTKHIIIPSLAAATHGFFFHQERGNWCYALRFALSGKLPVQKHKNGVRSPLETWLKTVRRANKKYRYNVQSSMKVTYQLYLWFWAKA